MKKFLGLSISQPAGDYDDTGSEIYTPNIHGATGIASFMTSDVDAESVVSELRKVVAEITNDRIPIPQKRRFGFLP